MAGHLGATAVLAALEGRRRSGEGDCIDLAIYEAALKLIELNVIEYAETGVEHTRSGNRIGSTAPRGSYACRDGLWLALSGSTQPVAERVIRTVGGPALLEDARFRTNADRVAHAAELDEYIAAWCRHRDRDTAIREFTAMGCAVGPLETVATMLENPQVVARGSVTTVHDPELGPMQMTDIYPRFEDALCEIQSTGPAVVGQHTEEVLGRDLGLSQAELAELRRLGVTGARQVHAEPIGDA
jgi:crotonobetainyl-CoA:carnitine CoA-transferase CaiB-like acyl-CoA transferase